MCTRARPTIALNRSKLPNSAAQPIWVMYTFVSPSTRISTSFHGPLSAQVVSLAESSAT